MPAKTIPGECDRTRNTWSKRDFYGHYIHVPGNLLCHCRVFSEFRLTKYELWFGLVRKHGRSGSFGLLFFATPSLKRLPFKPEVSIDMKTHSRNLAGVFRHFTDVYARFCGSDSSTASTHFFLSKNPQIPAGTSVQFALYF